MLLTSWIVIIPNKNACFVPATTIFRELRSEGVSAENHRC